MSSVQFGGWGAELLSLVQLLFFLALGYVVARMASRFRVQPAKAIKKIEDDEPKADENEEIVHEEPQEIVVPPTKVKSRHANAQERKRQRKSLEAANKDQVCKELVGERVEKSSAPVVDNVQEKISVVEQTVAQAPVKELQDEATSVDAKDQAKNDRVAKLMAKKSERKARKALEKKEQKEQVPGDDCANELERPLQECSGGAPEEEPVTIAQEVSEESDVMGIDEEEKVDVIDGISTPEVCLSPREMGMSPLMWCGMPQPEFEGGNAAIPQLIPQIEGWMPILVPAEHAPPGAFDGIWQNSQGERILIDHSEIAFETGITWVMQVHSLTDFSVKVEDEEFVAMLDSETRSLKWSDGDTWTCIGQTENQQQWANVAPPDPEVPCLLWDAAQVAGEPFFPPEMLPQQQPLNTLIPKDAENWEICWDWKKKGWCPRGVACDWYHPLPEVGPNFCKPCVGSSFDGPFSGE